MKKRPIVSALLAAVLLTSSWSPAAFAATIPAAAPQSVVQQVSISNLDQAKDAIHQALSNMSESVQLGQYGLTEQEFSDLYDAILREDPWLFYVEGCTFHVNRSGIVVDMIPRNTYDPGDRPDNAGRADPIHAGCALLYRPEYDGDRKGGAGT